MFGSRVIYRVLSENGYYDLAFNMVTRPEHPSFAWAIDFGLTTLPEQFNDPKVHSLVSLNHHCFCDISGWLYSCLAGIKFNPTARDIKNIDLSPCFAEKLNFAEASRGDFKVKWERKENAVFINVDFKDNYHGTIKLPKGYVFENGETQATLKCGTFKAIKE